MKAKPLCGKILRRAACILLGAALLLPLSGCGGRELFERLLIHGIGVDKDGDGVLVTVRSSASEAQEELFTARGSTVLEALGSLTLTTGRKPFYAHNYLVVFGKACAADGLDRYLDFFVRYYSTRPSVELFLAEDRAQEVLSSEKEAGYLKMSELQQLSESGRETGESVGAALLDFVNAARRPGSDPVLPVVRTLEGGGVEIVSTAYFKGFTLQGEMPLKETRGLLAAQDELRTGEAVVRGDFGAATLTLSAVDGEIAYRPGGDGPPQFTVSIRAEADVSAVSDTQAVLNEAAYRAIEDALEAQLKEEIEAAFARTARRDGCDVFGLGNTVFREDPSRWRTLEANWRETLGQCGLDIQVACEIHRLEQEIFGPALG